MDKAAHDDLRLLISRRWDPRVGMGRYQGRFEWVLGIILTAGVIFGFLIPNGAPLWLGFLQMSIVYGSVIVLACSWIYTRVVTRTKIHNRVIKYDGYVCVWCSFPLVGLEEQDRCPECGAGFRIELNRRLFNLAFSKVKPSPQEFGKRESAAWREAIKLRGNPEQDATP